MLVLTVAAVAAQNYLCWGQQPVIAEGIRIPNRFTFGQNQSAIEVEVPTGSYNAIRGYNGTQYIGTIHFFDDTWWGGSPAGSAASINLDAHTAVTLGDWQNPTAYFRETDRSVGIGTTDPTAKLDVRGGIVAKNSFGSQFSLQTNVFRWDLDADENVNNSFRIRNITSGTVPLTITTTGNVGIGMADPGSYKLAVEGKIGAREVNVTTSGWSDYVFHKDYHLRPLREVQKFISENHHLPDVPSEKEVLTNGQNLGEMNAILLKKIEELTLYIIKQEERIQALETAKKK
jgi:hypothetical protein